MTHESMLEDVAKDMYQRLQSAETVEHRERYYVWKSDLEECVGGLKLDEDRKRIVKEFANNVQIAYERNLHLPPTELTEIWLSAVLCGMATAATLGIIVGALLGYIISGNIDTFKSAGGIIGGTAEAYTGKVRNRFSKYFLEQGFKREIAQYKNDAIKKLQNLKS